MDTTLDNASPALPNAKDFLREHRDRVMVLRRGEGQIVRSEDFFVVESVGTHPTGLIVTGVFEHHRRQRVRPEEMRQATDLEIATHRP